MNNINAIPDLPDFPKLPSFLQPGIFERKKVIKDIKDKKDTKKHVYSNPSSFLYPSEDEAFGEEIITALKDDDHTQNADDYAPISPFLEPPETTTKPLFGQIIDFSAPVRKHPVYKIPPPLSAYQFNPSSLDQNIIGDYRDRDEAQ